MPQMAPLNWLSLFVTTILIFLIINSLNYFSFNSTPSVKSMGKMKSKNWKW